MSRTGAWKDRQVGPAFPVSAVDFAVLFLIREIKQPGPTGGLREIWSTWQTLSEVPASGRASHAEHDPGDHDDGPSGEFAEESANEQARTLEPKRRNGRKSELDANQLSEYLTASVSTINNQVNELANSMMYRGR